MTTVQLAAPIPTRLRITARGRRVLAFVATLPLLLALGAAVVLGGSAVATASSAASSTVAFETVVVHAGDTLWSIAGEVAPGEDPRDVVDALIRFNALGDASLAVGQTIAIPAEYTALR